MGNDRNEGELEDFNVCFFKDWKKKKSFSRQRHYQVHKSLQVLKNARAKVPVEAVGGTLLSNYINSQDAEFGGSHSIALLPLEIHSHSALKPEQ